MYALKKYVCETAEEVSLGLLWKQCSTPLDSGRALNNNAVTVNLSVWTLQQFLLFKTNVLKGN